MLDKITVLLKCTKVQIFGNNTNTWVGHTCLEMHNIAYRADYGKFRRKRNSFNT
jgi:hypothetical protein